MNALLLALLAGSYVRQFNWLYAGLVVFGVVMYAVADAALARTGRMRRALDFAFVTLVVFLIVLAPTLLDIARRHQTAPDRFIHDGAIQTEEAAKFLLAGKNPYAENYAATPMAQSDFSIFEVTVNPALEHNPYLPLTFILPIPFYVLAQFTLGWFDLRFVHLVLFLALWLLLPQLTRHDEKKLGLLIAFGLNPLFVPFFVEGRNDIVVLFWLAIAVWALQRNRVSLSALAFGLALTVKQTAWLVLPFYLLFLWLGPLERKWTTQTWRALVALLLPIGILILPFAFWDWRAFIDDAALFQSTQYPIWGYGISEWLVALGALSSRTAEFPFGVMQVAIGLPLLVVLSRAQMRNHSIKAMLWAASGWSFAMAFFSRAFLDNHIGFIVSLAILAYFVSDSS